MQADSAAHFFERSVPAKAAVDVQKLFGSRGSIAFKVGQAGWTFRFSSVEPIERRFDRSADLQLWFTEAAFAGLLNAKLDVAEATRSGEVKARGDLRLLELFGRFLQRDGAALGWDTGS